jgi:hypothetical protein
MIASGDRRVLISSMGWVDADSLWVFDVPSANESRIPLNSGARYLSLHCCHPSYFAVVHHFDGLRFEVTIHEFAAPGPSAARGSFQSGSSFLEGPSDLWKFVPRLYVEYLGFPPWNDFTLLRVAAAASRIDAQRLEWYDRTYDKDYQGVIGVLELPHRDAAIIAVQRSSRLVVHDLASGTSRATIELAGRGGNPSLYIRHKARELWASDYDSLVVVDSDNLRKIRSARFQSALRGTQQFIGDYAFNQIEEICVVARPFSGDLLGVDPLKLKVTAKAKVDGQPLEVALVGTDQIVARDWKTGRLLRGRLEPQRWWRLG